VYEYFFRRRDSRQICRHDARSQGAFHKTPTGLIAHQVAEIGLGIGFTAKVNGNAQLPKSCINRLLPLMVKLSFGLLLLRQRKL